MQPTPTIDDFVLALYATPDLSRMETIWNGRVGSLPMFIPSAELDGTLRRFDPEGDVKAELHVPSLEDRVFLDWERDLHIRQVVRVLERRRWDSDLTERVRCELTEARPELGPMYRRWGVGMLRQHYAEFLVPATSPVGTGLLVTVDEDVQRQCLRRRLSQHPLSQRLVQELGEGLGDLVEAFMAPGDE